MMNRTLQAERVSCSRNNQTLFDCLSFTLNSGEILHIKGPNGSGKTSLLRALCSLSPISAGEIQWCGQEISKIKPDYLQQMHYVGHSLGLRPELQLNENLYHAASLYSKGGLTTSAMRHKVHEVVEQFELTAHANKVLRELSAGQQRRASLAKLMITPATLWLLDEPFTALDQHAIAHFQKLMQAHVEQGGMIVLTSHQVLTQLSAEIKTLDLHQYQSTL